MPTEAGRESTPHDGLDGAAQSARARWEVAHAGLWTDAQGDYGDNADEIAAGNVAMVEADAELCRAEVADIVRAINAKLEHMEADLRWLATASGRVKVPARPRSCEGRPRTHARQSPRRRRATAASPSRGADPGGDPPGGGDPESERLAAPLAGRTRLLVDSLARIAGVIA